MKRTGFFMFIVFVFVFNISMAQELDNSVPISLIEKAAKYYAEEKWQGCRLISSTPYYALDGSINAYAIHFAKSNSTISSEDELKIAVSAAEEKLEIIENQKPENKFNKSITEIKDSSQISEPLKDYNAYNKWRRELRTARNKSVLADEIGTVLISARYDLYPLLEMHDGVAAHLKFQSKVKKLSGIDSKLERGIRKNYYFGPFAYFFEPEDGTKSDSNIPNKLVNPINDDVQDNIKQKKNLSDGKLKSAPPSKNKISPQDYWAAFESTGFPPKAVKNKNTKLTYNMIENVPYYHQDDYGPASCGAVSSAQALGYWDAKGYGNMVDNGSAVRDEGHEDEHIFNCMRAVEYDHTTNTGNLWKLIKVANDSEYANHLNFTTSSDRNIDWEDDIVDEIDRGYPFVYANWQGDKYPYWGHGTTGRGYEVKTDGQHILYVNYNYWPDEPYILNWDNIDSDNEQIDEVHTNNTTKFDCIWSEDFEGEMPADFWERVNLGLTSGWEVVSHRSHNITVDPQPPGGNTSYSLHQQLSSSPFVGGVDTILLYGPFGTMGRTSGSITFYLWKDIPDNDDFLYVGITTDKISFHGTNFYRGVDKNWKKITIDLANVPGYGSALNKSKIWIAFRFFSDNDTNSGEGVYIDDFYISLNQSSARMPIPANVRATEGGYSDKIRIRWDRVTNATHYYIYKMPEVNIPLAIVTDPEFEYFDIVSKQNDGFDYKVCAATSYHGAEKSFASAAATGWSTVPPPANVSATDGTYTDKVRLDWDFITNYNYYQYYIADGPDSNPIFESAWLYKPNVIDHISGEFEKKYYYAVRASKYSDGKFPTNYSNHDVGWKTIPLPTIEASDGTHNYVNIIWTRTENVYYKLFRATSPTGSKTELTGWMINSGYTDSTAAPGVDHYYFIKAASDSSGSNETDYSSYNIGWGKFYIPQNLSVSKGKYSDKIELTWNNVTGATHYMVSRKLKGGTSYSNYSGWITTNSYNDTSFVQGTQYEYTVSAALANGYHASSASTSDYGYAKLSSPSNFKATRNIIDKVTVSWNEVIPGAFYSLYRAVGSSTAEKTEISHWQTSTTYDDFDVIENTNYYYWAEAAADNVGFAKSDLSGPYMGSLGLYPPSINASDGEFTDRVALIST